MSTAASSINTASSQTLARRDLSSDLTALLSNPNVLSSLSSSAANPHASQSTTASTAPIAATRPTTVSDQSNHGTASTLLDAFAPSKATPDDSLGLARAYVRTMRRDVAELDDGSLDKLGERVDGVRERGTEVAEALAGVRV
jgi:propanediol dehydratase small subunit